MAFVFNSFQLGSLYLLSIFNLRFMGAVAPLGGCLCLGIAVFNVTK